MSSQHGNHMLLCRLWLLQSMVCFEHAVYNPSNIQKLLARALDDGKSGQSADNAQKWAAVVVSPSWGPCCWGALLESLLGCLAAEGCCLSPSWVALLLRGAA